MRNLSKAFLRVNAILSFVFMGLFILAAIVFFIVGSPLVSQYIENEGGAIGYTVGMMVGGAAFLFAAAMALISAIVSNKARALQTKGAFPTEFPPISSPTSHKPPSASANNSACSAMTMTRPTVLASATSYM